MTTSINRGPAKIYQFPVKTRSDIRNHSEATKEVTNLIPLKLAPARIAQTSFGGAWYHEEAIQEARMAGNE